MAGFRYKSLKSWKIDDIDLTQRFSLSIFTDFRYKTVKITWLLPIFIDSQLRVELIPANKDDMILVTRACVTLIQRPNGQRTRRKNPKPEPQNPGSGSIARAWSCLPTIWVDSSNQIQIRIFDIHSLRCFLGKDLKKVFMTSSFLDKNGTQQMPCIYEIPTEPMLVAPGLWAISYIYHFMFVIYLHS